MSKKKKKWSEKAKNNTRGEITQVGNELQHPELFRQQLALNKGLLKKCC